jgi:hypothetical protein
VHAADSFCPALLLFRVWCQSLAQACVELTLMLLLLLLLLLLRTRVPLLLQCGPSRVTWHELVTAI